MSADIKRFITSQSVSVLINRHKCQAGRPISQPEETYGTSSEMPNAKLAPRCTHSAIHRK